MKPQPTELQEFLAGIDRLTASQTGSRATFLVRELADIVGVSSLDIVDLVRTEADYWLDGKRFTHAGIKSELRRQWLHDRTGEVECEILRRDGWQLSLACVLGMIEQTALPGCPDWPVETLRASEVQS